MKKINYTACFIDRYIQHVEVGEDKEKASMSTLSFMERFREEMTQEDYDYTVSLIERLKYI